MNKYARITIRFNTQEIDKINSIMKQYSCSKSEAIRYAVRNYDNQNRDFSTNQTVANQFVQFIELVNEQEDEKLRLELYKKLEEVRCR